MHRDIKPENILLSENFDVKLCDFGWAQKVGDDEEDRRNSLCGTFQYMSPEVINKDGHGKKNDVWSLGIVAYEMAHGRPPFKGKNIREMKLNLEGLEVRIGEKVSIGLKHLIGEMLNKDPEKRFSIEQVLAHPVFTHRKKEFAAPIKPEDIAILKKNANYVTYGEKFYLIKQIEEMMQKMEKPKKEAQPPVKNSIDLNSFSLQVNRVDKTNNSTIESKSVISTVQNSQTIDPNSNSAQNGSKKGFFDFEFPSEKSISKTVQDDFLKRTSCPEAFRNVISVDKLTANQGSEGNSHFSKKQKVAEYSINPNDQQKKPNVVNLYTNSFLQRNQEIMQKAPEEAVFSSYSPDKKVAKRDFDASYQQLKYQSESFNKSKALAEKQSSTQSSKFINHTFGDVSKVPVLFQPASRIDNTYEFHKKINSKKSQSNNLNINSKSFDFYSSYKKANTTEISDLIIKDGPTKSYQQSNSESNAQPSKSRDLKKHAKEEKNKIIDKALRNVSKEKIALMKTVAVEEKRSSKITMENFDSYKFN